MTPSREPAGHKANVEQRSRASEKLTILVAASQGGSNGIETYTRLLVDGLRGRGHTAIEAVRHGSPSDTAAYRLPPSHGKVRRILCAAESITAHRPLVRTAKAIDADVIHATYPEFTPRGFASVVTAWHPSIGVRDRLRSRLSHGEHGRWSGAVFAMTDLLAYRRAAAAVATTQEVAERLTQAGFVARWLPPFIADDRISALPPGRDLSCLFVARWLDDSRKGLSLAVAAVAELRRRIPDVRLVLVGGFQDLSVAKRLPEFCDVKGVLDSSQILSLARSVGCQLVPSLWEEFGYVVLEGLAAGIPVICSPLPVTQDIASEGLWTVPRRSAAEWAAKIEQALESPGALFPREFLASTVLPQLEQLYSSVSQRT